LFPIKDENPSSTTPIINIILVLANIVVFFFLFFFYGADYNNVIVDYGMVPIYVLKGKRLYTLFTSMFLHGGFMHLFGNMVYLYIFGDNIEDAFGHFRYLLFYLICGVVADFTHILSLTTKVELSVPTIGASGAISGVLSAYLLLYPRAKILTLVFYGWAFLTAVPAIFFLGFWFLMQWLFAVFGVGGGVAYWAHIGGFVAGLVLAPIFRRRKKLFEASYGI